VVAAANDYSFAFNNRSQASSFASSVFAFFRQDLYSCMVLVSSFVFSASALAFCFSGDEPQAVNSSTVDMTTSALRNFMVWPRVVERFSGAL
jgi:dTDP-4-amino-4,6-dideoxygalactose transaminase